MIRLALRVARAEAELVLADLLEIAPSGVEEIELPAEDGGEGLVEYAVYGSSGELPDLPDLRAAAGGALVEISTSEIPDDWSERWKQFHHPVLVEAPGDRTGDSPVPALHVRPPWEAVSARPGVREIVIDPAQAFGTGAHATTRLCLTLLLELAFADRARGAVLDVGAGSGVLAIAAAQLGYRPVLALDNDRESVLATAANVVANGVEVDARRFDLRREALPEIGGTPVPVVLANLLKPLLQELAGTIASPPRHLIASGLLRAEADGIASAFAGRHGLQTRRRLESGDWAALWLTRD
ncbi:MAG: 50S ribosomal protein L11 methyltransferase [Solirubrobacteraceae bacterium]